MNQYKMSKSGNNGISVRGYRFSNKTHKLLVEITNITKKTQDKAAYKAFKMLLNSLTNKNKEENLT